MESDVQVGELTGGGHCDLWAPGSRFSITHCPEAILVLRQSTESCELVMSCIATVRESTEEGEAGHRGGGGRAHRRREGVSYC